MPSVFLSELLKKPPELTVRGLASEYQYLYYFSQRGYKGFRLMTSGENPHIYEHYFEDFLYMLRQILDDDGMLEIIKLFKITELYNKAIRKIHHTKRKNDKLVASELQRLIELRDYIASKYLAKNVADLYIKNQSLVVGGRPTMPDLVIFKQKNDKIYDLRLIEIKTNTAQLRPKQITDYEKINKVFKNLGLKEIQVVRARMTDTSCVLETLPEKRLDKF